QLVGATTSVDLSGVTLLNGAQLRLPDADSQISVDGEAIVGSKGDDTIVGGASDDALYGGRGVDHLSGGSGNDTLDGGPGIDELAGGDGDDWFMVSLGSNDNYADEYVDVIYGGEGDDTLNIDFSKSQGGTLRIASGAVSGIERLLVNSFNSDNLYLPVDVWRQFEEIKFTSVYNDDWYYYATKLNVTGDGGDFDLGRVEPNSRIYGITLSGKFATVDLSDFDLRTYNDSNDWNRLGLNLSDVDNVILGAGDNRLRVQGDTDFTANLGGGDDRITIAGVAKLTATIDGGAGDDTLVVENYGQVVDISGATLINISDINQGASSIVVTQTQKDDLSFSGSGAIFVRQGDLVTGSAGADSYSGDGTGEFKGGAGNDSIQHVTAAVFSGNKDEYTWSWSGQTLTVDHAGAEATDGTDTLTGVKYLRFADSGNSPIQIDDHANNANRYLSVDGGGNTEALTETNYDKPPTSDAPKSFATKVLSKALPVRSMT
ncbi:calcium-binding protein, partial [Shewanella sp.]|uniref:calcium-binding protein n=1 Tax=Shewanella sp. TaxID=50422 RepID=UPI004047DFF0